MKPKSRAIYFLTFTIVVWVDIFTRPQCRQIIVDSLKYCQQNKGLLLNAYVIMSNHIHLIAHTSLESKGMSAFIGDFKKFTARKLIEWTISSQVESRGLWMHDVFSSFGQKNSNNEIFQIWQRENHPFMLTYPKIAMQKLSYIHMNPVKAGIVDQPEEYLYCSARNYAGRRDVILEIEPLELVFTL